MSVVVVMSASLAFILCRHLIREGSLNDFNIGDTTFKSIIWSLVEPHKTVKLYIFNHIKVLQSHVVPPILKSLNELSLIK